MLAAGSRGEFSVGMSSLREGRGETTGRSLVLMRHGAEAMQAGIRALESVAGLTTMRAVDLRDGIRLAELPQSTAMMLDSIGVAVVNGDPDQIGRMSVQASRSDSILAVEPERVVYIATMPRGTSAVGFSTSGAAAGPGVSRDYLRGYRDGFDHAVGLCFEGIAAPPVAGLAAATAAFNNATNSPHTRSHHVCR